MNSKKTKSIILFAIVLGVLTHANNVFAENIYGIEYTGGEPLSTSNVIVDSTLSDLTPIYRSGTVSISDSDEWIDVYRKFSTSCVPYHFINVEEGDYTVELNDVYYVLSNTLYDVKVQINKITAENLNKTTEVGVAANNGYIYAGHGGLLYSDAECTVKYSDSSNLQVTDDAHVFVETNIKVYKHGTNELFTSDKMYFGITDIDAAQSFKILNADVSLQNNMYATSEDALTTVDDLNNMFVPSGNYIYSESHFDTPDRNNIFLKVGTAAQRQGLKMVFGYGATAGSGVRYYAKQHNVQYKSDEGGTITGITTEDIISGNLASGSTETPKEGFESEYWVADKDVVLENGTEIAAGEEITDEQLSQIVVSEDIVLTIIHTDTRLTVTYESDDYGEITGIDGEIVLPDDNPTGTEQSPEDNYEFSHWVADKDVVLEDGTEILAGDPITDEQLAQVVVTEDLVFTAIHKSIIVVPDTGTITNEDSGTKLVVAPIAGIIAITLLIKALPLVTRKKIEFDKQ